MNDFELKDIEGFDIDNFKQINFIVGKNGVGKSKFIFLLANYYSKFNFMYRPISPSFIGHLIKHLQRITFPTIFSSCSEENKIAFESELKKLSMNSCFIKYLLENKNRINKVPKSIIDFAWLLYNLSTEEECTLLFNGHTCRFHYSVMSYFISIVNILATKFNKKIIQITHSREFIKYAWDVLKDKGDILGLHRLEKRDGKLFMISYSKENLDTAMELNWEVR